MGFLLPIFAFFITFSLATTSFAEPAPTVLNTVGHSKEWKAILQYQKNVIGLERSEVDGASFFLSPEGATDPVAELKATLDAFLLPVVKDKKGESNEHALCRFPARFEVILKALDLSTLDKPIPQPNCASFRVYQERIQNRKVSVVFSSYYSGSASSVFGHSFLKFSGDNDNELFDTGINFAANPTTSNPILYSLYGLIGLFPATFSATPFYYKVREYNDFESRDLWAYEIKLTTAQTNLLIAHLWELGTTYFDYFYFNENCSYQILRAIEGAVPEVHFFDRRPIYLVPSESIKLLKAVPGLLGKTTYRPSIRNVTYFGFDTLNAPQREELFKDLADHQRISDDAQVVDVLMDAIDLNEAEKILAKDESIVDWKERVLQKRATLKRNTARLMPTIPENENPMVGHGSSRLAVGYSFKDFGGFSQKSLLLQARATHHDLLDPSIGYPRHLHIDFGRIGFRYLTQSKRFLLDDLTLVDLTALSLEHPLYSRWSYDVKIGYQRKWFADCGDSLNCSAVSARAGIGKTYPFFKKHTFFALMNFEPSYATDYSGSRFKFGLQPSLNVIIGWQPYFKSQLQLNNTYTLFTENHWLHELKLETRYVFADRYGLNLQMGVARQAGMNQSQVGLNALYYF